MIEVLMPQLAEGMEQGTIVAWLKSPGESVTAGQEIAEIETDKAAMSYAAEADGYLEIVAEAGDALAVGEVIARLHPSPVSAPDTTEASPSAAAEAEEGGGDAFPQIAENAEEIVAVADDKRANGNAESSLKATPVARRLARVHGVDLSVVVPTGPRGRITRTDVAAHAGISEAATREAPVAPAGALTARTPQTPQTRVPAEAGTTGVKGVATRMEPSRLQQTIARRMAEAKATIPHFQVQSEVKLDAALDLRARFKQDLPGGAPSLNDLVVKASALALRAHPRVNGVYRDNAFESFENINIGIAVASGDALVVPVITAADQRSISSIGAEARRLAERVRDQTITPPELAGGTFTISNLGMFGMTAIFPVINAGQSAILGVGAARTVAAVADGQLVERHLMTLTLSCDHRILYGADAAVFLSDIRAALESPLRLLA
jgi:pyruvate dehydrogenase E2 component (dihydrolipoamide acetyltransferase)